MDRPKRPVPLLPAVVCMALAWLPVSPDASADPAPNGAVAVTAFGGIMTDNKWEDVLAPWTLEFRESGLAGVAASRRLAQIGDGFVLEVEGQAVRHFGDQDHWEFNLPLTARWLRFPWDDTVDTSVAWGIGPSYATEVPQVELDNNETSQRWLVYWMAEVELALPDSPWSGVLRLHHRSDAFGLIGDDGGSNALAIGIRRQF